MSNEPNALEWLRRRPPCVAMQGRTVAAVWELDARSVHVCRRVWACARRLCTHSSMERQEETRYVTHAPRSVPTHTLAARISPTLRRDAMAGEPISHMKAPIRVQTYHRMPSIFGWAWWISQLAAIRDVCVCENVWSVTDRNACSYGRVHAIQHSTMNLHVV